GRDGGRRYGYYVCASVLQRGRQSCPSPSLPSATIEEWVIERLRQVAREAELKGPLLFTELADWDTRSTEERRLLLHTWIEQVNYDGAKNKAAIAFANSNSKS